MRAAVGDVGDNDPASELGRSAVSIRWASMVPAVFIRVVDRLPAGSVVPLRGFADGMPGCTERKTGPDGR